VAYFCIKCSQLFNSKDAAGCFQCNDQWGGEESLVGFLSEITGTANPNLADRAAYERAQADALYPPMLRTGT